MAAENRKDRGVSSEVSIPSGLNRIKTRLAPRPDESAFVTVPPPPFNNRIAPRQHGKTTSSKQGFHFCYDHFKLASKETKLNRFLDS